MPSHKVSVVRRSSRLERLLGPVFERQPDVILVGDWLVVSPIHHFIRGLWLQEFPNTGNFHGLWGVRNLWAPGYEPELDGFIHATHGSAGSDKNISFDELPETVMSRFLCKEVEEVTLPLLRSIDSMERLYELTMREPFSGRTEARFRLEIAMGNFDRARALHAGHQAEWFYYDGMFEDNDPADLERTRQLCRRLEENDYSEISRLLHEWEASAAKDFKVEHIWEPTPFPFEAAL